MENRETYVKSLKREIAGCKQMAKWYSDPKNSVKHNGEKIDMKEASKRELRMAKHLRRLLKKVPN